MRVFQCKLKLVFVLKIPLIKQQIYTSFHLYPSSYIHKRTGLVSVLSFTNKYITRNNDSNVIYLIFQVRTYMCVNLCKRMNNSDTNFTLRGEAGTFEHLLNKILYFSYGSTNKDLFYFNIGYGVSAT